jgi:hypothetical protein
MKHHGGDTVPSSDTRIKNACEGLTYISETDAPVEFFNGGSMASPDADSLLQFLNSSTDVITRSEPITESSDIDQFFQRYLRDRSRKNPANRAFRRLRSTLNSELDELTLIRIGRVRIAIYILGKDAQGRVMGIQTKAVET